MNLKLKIQNSKLYFLLATGYSLLAMWLLMTGCARGPKEPPKVAVNKVLKIQLKVAGSVTSTKANYLIAFEADGIFDDGPYFSTPSTFLNVTDYLELKNDTFNLVHITVDSNGVAQPTVTKPNYTFASFSKGVISATILLSDLGIDLSAASSIKKIDVNFIVVSQGTTVHDALGSALDDASVVHMDLSTETSRSVSDSAESPVIEDTDLDLQSASLTLTEF